MDAGLLFLQVTPTPGVGPEEVIDYWPALRRAAWFTIGFVVVFVLGWYAIEPATSRVVRRRNRNNPTIDEAISRYVRVLVVLVAVIIGAGFAGYGRLLGNSALVIAAGTLAVGVAGQSVIGSLVSGIVLVMDPEFNVGNYIKWGDRGGTVQSITLRVTRVKTPNGELVTIPNTTLTSEAITRPYGRGRLRVVEHIGLAYEDDLERAMDHLVEAAREIEGVLTDPAPEAYVDEFGGDAVVVRVHYWIEDPRRRDIFRIRSAYARDVKDRLEGEGITISPPSKRELLGRIGVNEAA
ncbi:MAG: mechanosensitive ion channel family protein [Halobacteriales archaeon]|nr:mechanosensitive ion channel family protein [Halobacteriales archaeon]